LIKNFGIKRKKLIIINNPVEISNTSLDDYKKKKSVEGKKNVLVAIGRLSYEKGYDLLLKAFSLLDKNKYILYIIGEGNEKEKLQGLSENLNIEKSIRFIGYTPDPRIYMEKADIFVLSSRFEGFPNVVLEAMSCGTQVVAFDCPGGTSEIIDHGINGWLVETGNIKKLAVMITYAVNNPLDGRIIRKSIYERYNITKIMKEYEKLIDQVVTK
jgi:glycosyltransferase involved in cell wall biosynthesis